MDKRSLHKLVSTAGVIALASSLYTLQPASANRWNWQNTLQQGANGLRVIKGAANAVGASGIGRGHGGGSNNGGSGGGGNESYDSPPPSAPSTPEPEQNVRGEIKQSPPPSDGGGYNAPPSNNQGAAPSYNPPPSNNHASAPSHHGGSRHAFQSGSSPEPAETSAASISHNAAFVRGGAGMPMHRGPHQPVAVTHPSDNHGSQPSVQPPVAAVVPSKPEAKPVDTSWCSRVMERSAVAFKAKASS